MTKKQTSKGRYDREYLELLIEEATADCYDEYEQAVGLFTIIGDELDLPFTTRVLGTDATMFAIEQDDSAGEDHGGDCSAPGGIRPIYVIPNRTYRR